MNDFKLNFKLLEENNSLKRRNSSKLLENIVGSVPSTNSILLTPKENNLNHDLLTDSWDKYIHLINKSPNYNFGNKKSSIFGISNNKILPINKRRASYNLILNGPKNFANVDIEFL